MQHDTYTSGNIPADHGFWLPIPGGSEPIAMDLRGGWRVDIDTTGRDRVVSFSIDREAQCGSIPTHPCGYAPVGAWHRAHRAGMLAGGMVAASERRADEAAARIRDYRHDLQRSTVYGAPLDSADTPDEVVAGIMADHATIREAVAVVGMIAATGRYPVAVG